MLDKIQNAFQTVFNVEPEKVNEETTIDNLKEWDSLKHLEMVMSLEASFGVKFQMSEIVELNSVAKIIEVLSEKGVAA